MEAAALKIKKVYELALKNGAPVIGIFDSKGGDIKEGMKTLGEYGEIAKMLSLIHIYRTSPHSDFQICSDSIRL